MNKKIPILPVILCGGSGSRLWPLSRKSFPKQYLSIDINDDFSFLQNTLNRIKKLKNLENPIIICNQEHRFITAEQIRKIEIKPKSIILEPLSRNTAPAIAIAALESMKNGDDPILLILPSDHQIKDNKEFLRLITRVNDLNLDKKILTFGVNPHSPSTAYGYIKSKKSKSEKEIFPLKIEKFLEKPNKTLAENIYQDDLYSWNSGIFISRASTIVNELEKYSPDIIFNCREALRKKINDLDFTRLEENSFKKCPNISFDKALMEKTDLGFVLPLNAKWSDIGGWKSFWDQSKKDPNGNVLIGDSIQLSSKNNLISSYSRLTIGFGINDLIIVETDDALLVTKKEHSDDIKLLVDELKLRNRKESEHNSKTFRPWGNFLNVYSAKNWKIKRIEVNPGASLSLQLHKKRAEHWVVVEGIAKVEINDKVITLRENQSCFVPIGSKHRLSNPGGSLLVIIEVQSGSYLGEDDIIRLQDVYGRKTN